MAGLATADFASAMKTMYLGPLEDLTFRSHVLLNRLEREKEMVSGNFAYIPLISGRNPAVGSRKDPATGTVGPILPAAGRQTYTSATYTMGAHYGRGSVSGTTRRKSRDDRGSFARAIDEEMKGLMRSLPDDLNRQVCGMGNGRAATLASTQASSLVIEVDSRDNFQARVGDRVCFADITAGSGRQPTSGTTISAIVYNVDKDDNVSTTKHKITLAAASGTSLTVGEDAMYYGQVASGSIALEDISYGQEIYGIQALVDDGDIGADDQDPAEGAEILTGSISLVGGIDRDVNAFWQSIVKKNPSSAGTKRPVTDTLIQEAWLTAISQHGAPPDQMEIYSGPALWGTVGMTQTGQRIYNDFKETVKLGFTFIDINGSKYFYDRDLPNNSMFFLDMTAFKLLAQNDYHFLDDDGNVIRVVAGGGRDAWEFSINRDIQLGASSLRTSVKLTDLNATMVVTGQLH